MSVISPAGYTPGLLARAGKKGSRGIDGYIADGGYNSWKKVLAGFQSGEWSHAKIIETVARIAKARGIPMAQVALAWTSSRPGITAPIIGATKPHHITDAVAALSVGLTDQEVADLERGYTPRALSGLSR